jgi:ATP-binding cassette subfamily B protein
MLCVKLIIKFYQFVGKYKVRLGVFLFISTIAVVLETISPYWLKRMLVASELGNYSEVKIFLGLFGASLVMGNLVSAWALYLSDRILVPLSKEIRETVFQKVLELDFAYHVDKNTGSLISAFRRGDSAVFTLFFNLHNELYRVLINLLVTVYFLSTVSWGIAGILVTIFMMNLGLITWLVNKNLKTRTEFNQVEDEISGVITDGMINYETVKYFAAEKKERHRLKDKFIIWSVKLFKFGDSFRLMDVIIGTTSGLGIVLMLWMTVNQLDNGLSNGDMIMVAGFVTGFYYQFFNLFFRVRDIAKCLTDLQKYLGILDNEVIVKDPKRPVKIDKIKGKVEFMNIGFVYPKNKERVLDKINLNIKEGEQVAFVGRSGAGKTTLVKLLIRFYDPSEGTIKVGGINIKKINKSDLRKLMGVVPQEPILFNNTIKFNLSYGKPEATMEEIQIVAKRANILEFIEKLPKSWETEVGERGIKLSGGQKQRLAIARALLSDPKILIFDEATSSLDSESEKMIQEALKEVSKSRTVIIIAHRFSTIRDADKIVVLSNGNIVEVGKHDQLIKEKGIYEKLWTLQSKGKNIEEN